MASHSHETLPQCRKDRQEIFDRIRSLEDFKAMIKGGLIVAGMFATMILGASVTTAIYTIQTSEDVAVIKAEMKLSTERIDASK